MSRDRAKTSKILENQGFQEFIGLTDEERVERRGGRFVLELPTARQRTTYV